MASMTVFLALVPFWGFFVSFVADGATWTALPLSVAVRLAKRTDETPTDQPSLVQAYI
jgi:hypothetical protein